MKFVKKIISCVLSGAIALCGSSALSVSAAGAYDERESLYEPGTSVVNNDSFETNEYLPLSSLLNKTYTSLHGNFNSNDTYTDVSDFYGFSVGRTTGSSGRVAIKLEGVPSGHNYDLYLYDANGMLVSSSNRILNRNEIIKTPVVSEPTSYYLEVRAETVPDYSVSSYSIIVDEYIETVTKTVSLSPTTLNASPDTWSTDAYRDMRSIPSDAIVLSATVSAKKGSSSTGYNNVIRVKLGNNNYETVNWKSGEIEVPGLIGQNCSGYWYAGFKASVLSGSIVSMNTFKLTIKYEYDKLISY